jgi:hypothetical protein
MENLLTGELADYSEQFRANRANAEQLCLGMKQRQFNWRPTARDWSVAECLVHLNISAHTYTKAIRAATAGARERSVPSTGPFRYGPFSRWLMRSMEPPVRKRYKTPRRFTGSPTQVFDVEQVLEEFRVAGREWEQCLHEAIGLDLARVKVRSPVVSLIRFQLGAVFAGLAAHERRHLWQATEVTKAQGFTSG